MPCFSFVTSTSFTCCCAAVALEETTNQRQRQKKNGSCCLAKQLLSGISGFSYERAVLAPLPGQLEPVSSVAKRLDIDFLHGAKHFGGYSNLRTNFIYFQRAGVIFHQTMFHFRRLHVFMIEIILSFIHQAGFHLLPSRYHFSSNNI